jgi:2-polyprenyl-3-methyl-5-hydroxy-6-metoxy-1,4-benzoquinol methylase
VTTDGTDQLERLDRERRAADARYNDALTALDRAVVAMQGRPLERQDVDRTSTALLQFLQQITAFVESKDRHLAADAAGRITALAPTLDAVAELRVQMSVAQRAIESLKRAGAAAPSAAATPQSGAAPSSIGHPHSDDYKYVGFEDQFRGSDAAIEERVRVYVPIFAGQSDVLDIGCGRGELLSALHAASIRARGIDTNSEMVAVARERGLDVAHADAVGYLATVADGSLGGIIATQVIEHLEPAYLLRLLDLAGQKLRHGAPIVLETINAACWLAFFSSYIRDLTHVRPIHPETLQYLLRVSGFERVDIRYSAPVPAHMKMSTIDLPADVLASTDEASRVLAEVAHTVNANAVILNNLLFSHLDFAAVGYRI